MAITLPERNITCPYCRFRHPASRSCQESKRLADAAAAARKAAFDAEQETVINLDDEMWREVKAAIVESPRFAEMYAAGGMLNDGISNTVSWLRETPEIDCAVPLPSNQMNSALDLAILFHDTYERLAPQFGYETRPATRKFSPSSPNGQLMRAVCEELLKAMRSSGETPAKCPKHESGRHWCGHCF